VLRFWTIQRASGVGTLAGIAALFLWPAFAACNMLFPVFAAALAVTAFCGLSILAISAVDLATRRRGASLRPVRSFDVAWGLLLAGPSIAALIELL